MRYALICWALGIGLCLVGAGLDLTPWLGVVGGLSIPLGLALAVIDL